MQVYVNGDSKELPETTSLAQLIELLELAPTRIAIELNRVVVRRADWDSTVLSSGDRLEIVHFVGGGCDAEFKLEPGAAAMGSYGSTQIPHGQKVDRSYPSLPLRVLI